MDKLGCLSLGGVEVERPFSDTSSDSGCNLGMEQQMMSPYEMEMGGNASSSSNNSNVDLLEYIANGEKTTAAVLT